MRLNWIMAAVIATLPMAAVGQTSTNTTHKPMPTNRTTGTPRAAGGGQASGQQQGAASPSQNQSQMQTDNSQQPPQVHTLPPSASAQTQPNPLPQLAR